MPWWWVNSMHRIDQVLYRPCTAYIEYYIILLRLWCYRYTSRIIQDHSIIQIWILNQMSWVITGITLLDQPSGFVHLLVISPLPDLHTNWSTTAIMPSADRMCIIFRSVLVVESLLSMVIAYRQETLFIVAEQTTILTCPMDYPLWDEISSISEYYRISRYAESYRRYSR